jgi:hypothetical protein
VSSQHIPTLSDIVDMIQVRFEGIADTGNPEELAMLVALLDRITVYAQREQRLARLAEMAASKEDVA